MERKIDYRLVIILALAALFIPSQCSLALDAFDMTVTLTEGGYRLELSPSYAFKGVEINVTSTTVKYEVIQKVIQPLTYRKDPSIVIRDDFVVRSLRGTNIYGDLRIPPNDPGLPVRTEEILYIDNTAQTDTFTLVYGVKDMEKLKPGEYLGRLAFYLKPTDSTREPVTRYLDVYVFIQEREAAPVIRIAAVNDSGRIRLHSNKEKEELGLGDVRVDINGKFKNIFSIKQVISQPLIAKDGSQLDYGLVNYAVKEARKGLPQNAVTPLALGYQDLYTSEISGLADESFIVSYTLGDISKEKAGQYRSNIQYYLEDAGKTQLITNLALEVEIERLFDLKVKTELETGRIEFLGLKPSGPTKNYEVSIEVKTNIGKRYQITQKIPHDLVNKEGLALPEGYFTLKTEMPEQDKETKGALNFVEKTPVKKGDAVLYVSDKEGSAVTIKAIYGLQPPVNTKPGDYSTFVSYSLSEI